MAEYERFGSATMGYMLLAEMDKQVKKILDKKFIFCKTRAKMCERFPVVNRKLYAC
jgi:hypothetical protein